jgi:hypothetical protein
LATYARRCRIRLSFPKCIDLLRSGILTKPLRIACIRPAADERRGNRKKPRYGGVFLVTPVAALAH